MTPKINATITSPLVKIFPGKSPSREPECTRFSALRNETVSFQVAYILTDETVGFVRVGVESPIAGAVRVRRVSLVPCELPAFPTADENYLGTEPGLYPDLLEELHNGQQVRPHVKRRQSLWVDVCVTDDMAAGDFPIRITFNDPQTGEEFGAAETSVKVRDASLPELHIPRTEWFHGDCLADYYNVPVLSEEHWAIMERFIGIGVKRDINAFLTPQFTPPLDTAKGGERTTIQLVGVTVRGGNYEFDFTNLKRWVDMCLRVGVKYFEMSHLFTQWGAESAPKVMAMTDDGMKRIFGWDTPATGGEYTRFLQAYLPQLTANLKAWGIADRTMFHISDEPSMLNYDSYRAAKDSVAALLEGFDIVDALSNLDFYSRGAVQIPAVATNHIDGFLECGAKPLWAYYCCSQGREVSNRFIAMPSARARVYGAQLFKYDIDGALHWGYNFYNSQRSLRHINPYRVTDADCAFPSGDSFLVYPGANGMPEESIRMMTMYNAMTDLRAMRHLAELAGKEFVMNLIEGELSAPLTFKQYPKSDAYFMNLRYKINAEIERLETAGRGR